MDPDVIQTSTALVTGIGASIVSAAVGFIVGRRYRPCRTSRCQQREQCIAEYQTNPDGYEAWLESKGAVYKASCADIPPSTNKFG